jgi:ubiquitin-protein ligase
MEQNTVVSPSHIFISRDTFRRLVSDVKDIVRTPLHSHGIYYTHDEDDILRGKALIIGSMETPYENGFYLFDFNFPANYPHSPPEVIFLTNDGETRFNPNLYINGKVCLSILNTWQGEPWSGCQNISSVLLALCTLLNNKPFLNEPCVTEQHSDYDNYNKIITYKNFDTAMLKVLNNDYTKVKFGMFIDIMQSHFLERFDYTISKIRELCKLYSTKQRIQTSIYRLDIKIDYNELLENCINVKDSLCKINKIK